VRNILQFLLVHFPAPDGGRPSLEHDDDVEARNHHSNSNWVDGWISDVRCVEIVVGEMDLQGFVLEGEER